MGCDPIIFVGMDLAYTGNHCYANDVVFPHETFRETEELTKKGSINTGSFIKKGVYGDNVLTLWKWIKEAQYITSYAQAHSSKSFVNCTEGGLGIEGVEHLTLSQAVEKYMKNEYDFFSWSHASVQYKPFHRLNKKLLKELFFEIQRSLLISLSLCEETSDLISSLFLEIKKRRGGRVCALEKKIEEKSRFLEKEMAYQQIIEPVSRVNSRILQRKINRIRELRASETQKSLETWKEIQGKIFFYRDTAGVNLLCLKEALDLL
ncbi:hypothetical protein AB751O23_BU_00010 [Chlamydiales bacterium SCGC AB-751-O23]|nr:hypothetical protein AB751O23_BU_00010 [Chlamydiales bacterium SCGC AB-751-O23]